MSDLAVNDVVQLDSGEIVLVTDVPFEYEGMTETLFVYTTNLDNGCKTEDDLAVTDRSFIKVNLGQMLDKPSSTL